MQNMHKIHYLSCKKWMGMGVFSWILRIIELQVTQIKNTTTPCHLPGLIYRDNRLINWCSYLRTALSDLEVDYEEITGRTLKPIPGSKDLKVEVGVMCHFSYKMKDSEERITVATYPAQKHPHPRVVMQICIYGKTCSAGPHERHF